MHLSESWKLRECEPGEGVAFEFHKDSVSTEGWIDVAVPGDVHRTLIDAGRIPDPFFDRNEFECAWMEEREWWYRLQFDFNEQPLLPDERLQFVFHGLDTYVSIWLNGEKLGKHANMFREAVFDVSKIMRTDGVNTLALCFDPPHLHVQDKEPLHWPGRPHLDPWRNLSRKAQFGYGWDWGPRLPTIGIWRPVELRRQRTAAICGLHFFTQKIAASQKNAELAVKIEAERFSGDTALEAEITLSDPSTHELVVEKSIPLKQHDTNHAGQATFNLENPKLWWTHDLGEPFRYSLQIRLLHQDNTELDREEQLVGVRTLELDQSLDADEPGTRFFRFILNGTPIFARGANWVPADSFVGALTQKRYQQLLEIARDANMNMLRVWGGGIYEHDDFYELCDRLGILIWQDFMFACAPYPEDDLAFVEEVRQEVRYQIRRLRNHPCLALWCGNNENQMLHRLVSLTEEIGSLPGLLYYDEIMPEAVEELDGVTPYWPGSSFGGPYPNSMDEGDVHDWNVWHGLPVDEEAAREVISTRTGAPTPEDVSFLHYAEDMGRFISEFGMHASPVHETLRRCMPADQLYHHSPSMDHHNKDNPKDKGDRLMLAVTGLPQNLQEFIDFSMIAQAEGLKFGIEHFRRRKPHCSGSLLWQFNDCWPVQSWSIVDYYGFGKAGYYYVKRAYAPLMASFRSTEDGIVELWITNDTLEEFRDEIVIQHGSFAGDTTWKQPLQVRIPANCSQRVWQANTTQIEARTDHFLNVRSSTRSFPANRHFFAPIKDLQRTIEEPDVTIESISEHELQVQVRTSAYLFYFHLIVPDERTFFSDNYFDLAPGESATVVVRNDHIKLTAEKLTVGWRQHADRR